LIQNTPSCGRGGGVSGFPAHQNRSPRLPTAGPGEREGPISSPGVAARRRGAGGEMRRRGAAGGGARWGQARPGPCPGPATPAEDTGDCKGGRGNEYEGVYGMRGWEVKSGRTDMVSPFWGHREGHVKDTDGLAAGRGAGGCWPGGSGGCGSPGRGTRAANDGAATSARLKDGCALPAESRSISKPHCPVGGFRESCAALAIVVGGIAPRLQRSLMESEFKCDHPPSGSGIGTQILVYLKIRNRPQLFKKRARMKKSVKMR